MSIFVDGSFVGHAGLELQFKIECDGLTDEDIATIAALIARNISFREVYGIPRGGMRLAAALEPYRSETEVVLIADDVYTTGMSMAEFRKNLHIPPTQDVVGVVIFARGPCPAWVRPVFQLA